MPENEPGLAAFNKSKYSTHCAIIASAPIILQIVLFGGGLHTFRGIRGLFLLLAGLKQEDLRDDDM